MIEQDLGNRIRTWKRTCKNVYESCSSKNIADLDGSSCQYDSFELFKTFMVDHVIFQNVFRSYNIVLSRTVNVLGEWSFTEVENIFPSQCSCSLEAIRYLPVFFYRTI